MENGVLSDLESIKLPKLYNVYINGKLACTNTEESIAYKLYCEMFPTVQMVDMRFDSTSQKAN